MRFARFFFEPAEVTFVCRRSQASAEALEKENMKVSWLESRDGDFFQGRERQHPEMADG